jgi:hypothetical protein
MAEIKLWDDLFNVRREGTAGHLDINWVLADIGVNETMLVLPEDIDGESLQFIYNAVGSGHTFSHSTKQHYVAISHRMDDVIEEAINKA